MSEETNRSVSSPEQSARLMWQIRWRLVPAGLFILVGMYFLAVWLLLFIGMFLPPWKIERPSLPIRMYQFLFMFELLVSGGCWILCAMWCFRRRWWLTIVGVTVAVAVFFACDQHRALYFQKWMEEYDQLRSRRFGVTNVSIHDVYFVSKSLLAPVPQERSPVNGIVCVTTACTGAAIRSWKMAGVIGAAR